MSNPQHFIICLIGPTASGKTALAVDLVQRFLCEIISVDSAMVYHGLNIGSAKPNAEILQRAPHRLLDIRDPAEVYSAGNFISDAEREIADILHQGKIPLLVGGTMLYFHLLQQGLDQLPIRNEKTRQLIQEEAEQQGWPWLHQKLAEIDPQAATRIHPHDSQRIQRALEVYTLTGKPITEAHQQQLVQRTYQIHNIILCPQDRHVLHQRIEQRFLQMLEAGFLDEVKQLYQRTDLSLQKPALRCAGYRQAWEYLSGELSFDEMKEKAIIATRQLAKRQITWLRRWKNAAWFNSEDRELLKKVTEYISGLFKPSL